MDERTERIRSALASHGAELVSVKPLHGGACQENYAVDVTIDGRPLRLALRSDAPTSLPASIRRRDEYAVIQAAVAAGVRTPNARWLSVGLLGDGADAYFLDWVPGEAIGRRVVRNPELEQARAGLPLALAESLAALHRIEHGAAGIPLKRLTVSPAQDALNQIRSMLDNLPGNYPAVEFAHQWLSKRMPVGEPTVLVHGDFRTGNFLITPDGLAGILDWEFSHWGAAGEDLSWISVRDWRFNQLDKPIGGFSAREPFYEAYARASGSSVNLEHLWWWEILGNLRWAVGSVYQGERYLSGAEKDLELIAIARRNVEMEFEALRLIQRGGL